MPPRRAGSAIFAAGALLAAADVGLRAWQAHGLEGRLAPAALELFATARAHQFQVAIGLLAAGLLRRAGGGRLAALAAAGLALGGALFCGDLYGAAFRDGHAALGLAPWGGMLTMLAWLSLAAAAWRGAGTQIRTGG
jgi:uncharacterized membrane protein YgdD (TMEM256/DUF423 family)